jgi:ribonuclease-3
MLLPDLSGLQKSLGISFRQPALLRQALVHSSYINENPDDPYGDNEKLEFLGDAVLGFIIAERLYRECPDSSEGEMTRLRAALVNGRTLAGIARRMGIGEALYMGRGEESSGGRNKKPNLAGALEALIAAVYLDRGITATRKFVLRLFSREIKDVLSKSTIHDAKSRLQEIIQSRSQEAPLYRIIGEEGPDHNKTFDVEVIIGGVALGRGTGKSKKQAETAAAQAALEKL